MTDTIEPNETIRPAAPATEELLQMYYMGEISEENARLLLQRLEEHPDAYDEQNSSFADGLWMHCLLRMLFQSGRSEALAEFFDQKRAPSKNVPFLRLFSQWGSKRIFVALSTTAVLLALILGVLNYISTDITKNIVPQPPGPEQVITSQPGSKPVESGFPTTGVAKVRALSGVQWSPDSELIAQSGDILGPGRLRIESGSISLVFFSGASVTIDGPAEFHLINEDRAYCAFGEVYAEVPQQAIGFQIDVPQTKVVDLGTSFGLKVGQDQSVVHVITGEVELRNDSEKTQDTDNKLLERGESLIASGGGVEAHLPRVPVSEGDDYSNSSIAINMERIFRNQADRLDQDPAVLARIAFPPEVLSDATVDPARVSGTLEQLEFVPGRLARWNALHFHHQNSLFQFEIPGRHEALTLAAWIRIDRLRQKYNTICSTHGFEPGAVHWYLLYDGSMEIQVRSDDSVSDSLTFRTDQVVLPWVGSWSHLAVTLDRRKSEICMYLNGIQVFRTKEFSMPSPFQLERLNLGNWTYPADQPMPTHHVRSLQARMEDFIIFNRSLSSKEIRELFMGDYVTPSPNGF